MGFFLQNIGLLLWFGSQDVLLPSLGWVFTNISKYYIFKHSFLFSECSFFVVVGSCFIGSLFPQ